jgi:gamma-glutamylcyclotransferase (GGCT)/AIG2-like uncharacterized protein YtfP
MTDLSRENRLIVAVYGSLKRGFYNHRLLERSTFLSDGQVQGFEMFSLGSFPMVTPGRGAIAVELFEVDHATFAQLDRLEGFPNFYGRTVVTVSTAYCPVQAWLYVGRREQVKGHPRVRSGLWQLEERQWQRR